MPTSENKTVQSIAPKKKYRVKNVGKTPLSITIGNEEFPLHVRAETPRPLTEAEIQTKEVAKLIKWGNLRVIEVKE